MAFRRDGRSIHCWQTWLQSWKPVADACGLPSDVLASQEDFEYLLMHGYNRAGWHNEAPWFEINRLMPEQLDAFRNLVESFVETFSTADERDRTKGNLPLAWLWDVRP